MINIAIGKIGQKLIFDRSSEEARRSNNNGNVDAYKFYKLLIEKFPECQFYVFGDNDGCFPYKNVYDFGNKTSRELMIKSGFYGLGIFYCGLEEFDTGLIDFINRSNIKYLLFTTDSRCVPQENSKLTNKPIAIFSMANDRVGEYDICYSPIVTSLGYKETYYSLSSFKKDIDIMASMSESKNYDRIGKLFEIIQDDDVHIYGRINSFVDDRLKGEIKYEEIIEIYKRSKMTILAPIDKKWITGKYIECLLYNVVPLFLEDYGYEYFNLSPLMKNLLVIDSREKYKFTTKLLSESDELRNFILLHLRNELHFEEILSGDLVYDFIKPFISVYDSNYSN